MEAESGHCPSDRARNETPATTRTARSWLAEEWPAQVVLTVVVIGVILETLGSTGGSWA